MVRRILYLSPYFWPEEIGSAPYCTELAVWLRERGHDVRVVSFRPHYPNPNKFEAWADGSRDEESHNSMLISRVSVRDRGRGGFTDRLKNDLSFLWQVLRRALRREFKKTDVIVAYAPTILTLYGAQVIGRLTGASIVGVAHDIESGLATSLGLAKSRALLFLMRTVERIGLNFADQVIVLTEGMREEIQHIGCRRPISVFSIWASVPAFSPIAAEEAPVIMYSGNFGKKQNLDQLLPLIQRLWDEKKAIRVVMRGDVSEKDRLQKKIEGSGIANTVFLPLASAEEFLAALQSANIHMVPQALNVGNYALPSKVFSSMSAGRPFVCIAEEGSPLDRLARQSGAGICIRPGDDDALYRAVVELVNDPDRQIRMGPNGRLFVGEYMNKETILKSYEDVIQSCQ